MHPAPALALWGARDTPFRPPKAGVRNGEGPTGPCCSGERRAGQEASAPAVASNRCRKESEFANRERNVPRAGKAISKPYEFEV